MNEIDLLKRRLDRERQSRKQAETILEQKALELYHLNNELRALNEGLEARISQRTGELQASQSRLTALIENLHAAVLVEDEHRHIVLVNHTFCSLFQIPLDPKSMGGMDCSDSAQQAKHLFADPECFVDRINHILQARLPVIDEVCEMADGRMLERDYIPIHLNEAYMGHLWQYRDVTAAHKAQDRLRRSEEKYRGIIENMELGLLEVDLNGIIVRPYPLFCKMTGYESEELVGKSATDVLLPPEYVPILHYQQQKRHLGETGVYEVPLVKKGGERLWALISGAPITDIEGRVTGSIGIHYDITRQKNLQRELEEARQRAEAAQEAEKQFLANMSHEIRTPLNAIIGMAHLLYDTGPSAEQLELLNILKNSADLLRTLINDVLDLSKVRAGKLEVQQNEFDLTGLVRTLLKSVELRLHDRPIRVVSELDPSIVHTVIGDDLLLNQILLNLLGNAEKFTEQGEIGIRVRRLTHPAPPDNAFTVQFQVFDTGIGIAHDKQEVIFQDFRQVDGDIKRRYGGTGLGLSITKKLVEIQGGVIAVQSQLGKGSLFTFQLNYIDTGRMQKTPQHPGMQEQFTGRAGKILIAEDNPMNRRYIQTLLNKWGIEFVKAYNGLEAVARSREERFDLILMDIQMPEMDGYEACLAIRHAQNPNQHTPIIALTASAMNSKKDKAFAVGMNDYLSKPFEPAQLLAKLHYFLRDNLEPDAFLPPVHATAFQFDPLLDHPVLQELYADDLGYAFEMFGMFLRYTLKELESFPTLMALADWEGLQRLAHKVKPTFTMVGRPDLEKQFELLEHLAKSAPDPDRIREHWLSINGQLRALESAVLSDWEKLKTRLNE